MKKFNLFAAIAACIVFVSSCGNSSKKEEQVVSTPVKGTEYAITSTKVEGKVKYGISKNNQQVVDNKFIAMSYNNGMFVGKFYEKLGRSEISSDDLIDPETGKTVIQGESVQFKDGYFVATSGAEGNHRYSLYFPDTKKSFNALAEGYVLKDNILISKVYDGWGAITTANDTLLVPDNRKLALLETAKGNYFLYYDEGRWVKINAKREGDYVSAAELKQLKKLSGWSDTKEAFVVSTK